jgi:hypothetical protein
MEQEIETLREMKRQIAALEAERSAERARASDLRMLALLFGLIILMGAGLAVLGDAVVVSRSTLFTLDRMMWLLFAMAGAGLGYAIVLQFQHNARVRTDGARMRDMMLRDIDRQP